VRTCGNCGRPTEIQHIKHGRGTGKEHWFVHTETGLVPCDPETERRYREPT
jgi:hypothetical protein